MQKSGFFIAVLFFNLCFEKIINSNKKNSRLINKTVEIVESKITQIDLSMINFDCCCCKFFQTR